MKQFYLLTKTLLVVVSLLVGGANSAWGETIATMGNNDQGMEGNTHTYTLSANKTLTLTFTVTSTKGENETQGYYVNLKQGGNDKMGFQPGGGFYYYGDEWWNETHIVKNDRSWGNLSDFTSFIPGATVELTIKRIHTQVMYYADIKTSAPASARHYRRLITKESTFDENADLSVILGADHAVLTGITDVTTDESITGTLIGKEDNSVDFNGDGAVNQAFTLGADKSLTLYFINYSSKIGNGDNWMVEIQNGDKYLDIKSDKSGWDYNAGAEYYSVDNFDVSSNYSDGFPKVLHKANVALTVSRSSNTITITAVQKCTNSEVKRQTYTLTHSDFTSGDITVRLYAAYSHLDLLPVTVATIGTTGWTTFASAYPLDLSNMTASEGDVKAYYASAIGEKKVTMTSTESTGVAAGEGLMLKGTVGATITIPVAASGTAISGNKLVGCTSETVLAKNASYYVLVNNNGAEFQSLADYGATIPAGKAYLDASTTSGARLSIVFDDATAIKTVDASAKSGAQADGKYLEKGKIVIVKNGTKFNANGQRMK